MLFRRRNDLVQDKEDEARQRIEKNDNSEKTEPISEIAQELDELKKITGESIDEALHIDEYVIPENTVHMQSKETEEKEETEEIFVVLEKESIEIVQEEEQDLFGVLEDSNAKEE